MSQRDNVKIDRYFSAGGIRENGFVYSQAINYLSIIITSLTGRFLASGRMNFYDLSTIIIYNH